MAFHPCYLYAEKCQFMCNPEIPVLNVCSHFVMGAKKKLLNLRYYKNELKAIDFLYTAVFCIYTRSIHKRVRFFLKEGMKRWARVTGW